MPYLVTDPAESEKRTLYMDELLQLPLRELSEQMTSGRITSKALTRTYLDRIEQVNPRINAVVHLDGEMAMKHAERNDLALKSGETPGKLFGIPMTIKDSLNTYDMVTTWGTTGRKNFRPGKDATCVARLRNQGAILMGKSNTPEFTLAFKSENALFPKTNNPYDFSRTSGGSSGGAAALLACHGTPFEVGTDTGGSIRLPAHFCGVAGIKPTTGRVPCSGNALPSTGLIAPLTQPGPMARRVDDLAFLLEMMIGPDNLDPHAVPNPWLTPDQVDVPSLRVAWHTDNGLCKPDADIVAALEQVRDLLIDHQIKVTDTRPTGVEMSAMIYGHLMRADDGDMVEALLDENNTELPSTEVAAILERTGHPIDAREFAQVISLWHSYQSSMLSLFDEFDVLICPVNGHTAIPHDVEEDFLAYTYTAAYNLTGWPGLVIRAGTDSAGLPIGVQILAAPFREDRCLALGSWLEARLGEFTGPEL